MPRLTDSEIEQIKERLSSLFIKYCEQAQQVLPQVILLVNIRKEIDLVVSTLEENEVSFDPDDIAKKAGISEEALKSTFNDFQKQIESISSTK